MSFLDKLLGRSASDREQIDIVGESFYKNSFKIIRDQTGAKVGQRVAVRVELRIETDNLHAYQGKAIAAFVNGLPVGHVSSIQLDEAFTSISSEGGVKVVSGSIFFADHRESVAKNSVSANYQVKKNFAPAPSQQEVALKEAQFASNQANLEELQSRGWSQLRVEPGHKICFTQFGDLSADLENHARIFGLLVANSVVKTLDLLVVNDQEIQQSSKVQKAIGFGVPVTNLETFLEVNPNLRPKSLR